MTHPKPVCKYCYRGQAHTHAMHKDQVSHSRFSDQQQKAIVFVLILMFGIAMAILMEVS